MFEKIFSGLFYYAEKRKGITFIGDRREIATGSGDMKRAERKVRDENFWNGRGKIFAVLFKAVNERNV